ncbi:DUF433 domain-containing protein [Halovivax cerinus]|uniref:DUF433 domain-containing protein n=1 Tax=Halovivax cerinus TaxID=1487865 RepID=A0ABD5NPT7_9EURY|nr:DUF433 domain-containing protein [Halovivax cerinus]
MTAIVRTDDVLGGDPRIEGTRIGVLHVFDLVIAGTSTPEDAADQLGIGLGDVYGALSYYYDHADEMARIRARHESLEDELAERTVQPPTAVE